MVKLVDPWTRLNYLLKMAGPGIKKMTKAGPGPGSKK